MTVIREARPDDAEGIAKVHVDVWRSTYRGIMPDKVLDELSYEQRSKVRREALEKNDPKYRCFVAEDDQKRVLGFVIAGPRREGNEKYSGEIYAIYLFQEFQGHGIGKKLFIRACEWLRSQSHQSTLVWVLRDNPTRHFYERMGGKELDSKVIEIGAPLVEVSYGWDNVQALLEGTEATEANDVIEFLPLRDEHIPFLRQWLKEPHVAEFWQETENEEEFRQKFLNKLPDRGVSPFVIALNSKPIGYIQYYEARKVGGGWWPDAHDGTFGIDQFIGDSTLVGRGLGTKIIKQFVDDLFRQPNITEVITDPDPKNKRAIRAYEKAGFAAVGEIKTPGGEALLMKITLHKDGGR